MAVAALRCWDIRAIIDTCVAYGRTEELARMYMAAGTLCDRDHLIELKTEAEHYNWEIDKNWEEYVDMCIYAEVCQQIDKQYDHESYMPSSLGYDSD